MTLENMIKQLKDMEIRIEEMNTKYPTLLTLNLTSLEDI